MRSIDLIVGCFCLCFSSMALSASISEPEFRTAAHCDSAEDYALSKQGTFSIEPKTMTIRGQTLVVRAQVLASQCQQLDNGTYQWASVSPIGKLSYEHSAFDAETKTLVPQTVTVEYKDSWLSMTNHSFSMVGTSKVLGSIKKGFFAEVAVPLLDIMSPQQVSDFREGQSQTLSIYLFVKSRMRYIVNAQATPYEESSGAGLYQIDFVLHNQQGRYSIQ